MYILPFTASAKATNLIAEISAYLERFVIRMEQTDGIRLRKDVCKLYPLYFKKNEVFANDKH